MKLVHMWISLRPIVALWLSSCVLGMPAAFTTPRSSLHIGKRHCPKLLPSQFIGRYNSQRPTSLFSEPTVDKSQEKKKPPYSEDQMKFYTIGINLAQQVGGKWRFRPVFRDFELDIVLQGFVDCIRGLVPEEESLVEKYSDPIRQLMSDRETMRMVRSKQDGINYAAQFLDKHPAAIRTDSGLVFLTKEEGTGSFPLKDSTVEVQYEGKLLDGTIFASSYKKGQSSSFAVNRIPVKGWQEGLTMMREGGKATMIIPPQLAYGEEGNEQIIPPGATLQFEVELLNVIPTDPASLY